MRKTLAIFVVLLIALAGIAHAEPAAPAAAAAEPAAEPGYVLVARLEADGSYSYALLGAGDGADAFASLAGEGETYEERFQALLAAISELVPEIAVEGGEEALTFALGFGADGSAVQVSLGSEALATLAGKTAFAIATGSFAASPVLSGECEAYIWTPDGILRFAEGAVEGESLSLCPNCGKIDDGGAEHDEVISEFCKEGHTKCMGDPEHFCDPDDGGCGRTYPCSKSNSHTKCAKCGELWCYKKHGDHKELACGHRGCEVYGEEAKHAKCPACGGYLCDGGNHALELCGKHHLGAAGDHTPGACGITGHFNCDDKNHSGAVDCDDPSHRPCDGLDHSTADCDIKGHFNCDGDDHSSELPCGHYACEDGDHSLAECGLHYVCEGGDHYWADCGWHSICEPGDHSELPCGDFVCYGGTHDLCPGCDEYICQGGDHTLQGCGHYVCVDGDHTASCNKPGHYSCDPRSHSSSTGCNNPQHTLCDGLIHAPALCGVPGHYLCDGLPHYPGLCGMIFPPFPPV